MVQRSAKPPLYLENCVDLKSAEKWKFGYEYKNRRRYSRKRAWRSLDVGPPALAGPPRFWSLKLRHQAAGRMCSSSIVGVSSGRAPLPPAYAKPGGVDSHRFSPSFPFKLSFSASRGAVFSDLRYVWKSGLARLMRKWWVPSDLTD